jgi:phosphoenolpyruvate carboxykinase (GTP)
MRVLKWMIDRIEGHGRGEEHIFGVTPRYPDLHWVGLDFSADQYLRVTSLDLQAWRDELKLHDELFAQLSHRLPQELVDTKDRLIQRLSA